VVQPTDEIKAAAQGDNFDVASEASSKGGSLKHTLFVKNLSDEVEESDLEALFAAKLPQVRVLAVRLIRDKIDSTKRGIAFVDVATSQMAEQALELN